MLTALVCTRGRPHLLEDCLTSLAAGVPADGELIVVERMGSDVVTDAGPRADALLADLGVPTTYVRTATAGKSRQLNEGLRRSAHDIAVITDDDCRVEPGWLAAMAAPFEDPSVGAVFGHVVGLSSVEGHPQRPVPIGEAPRDTWSFANGAAMAVRRRAVADVGGFDERLGPGATVHGEEHDLVLRLREAGWKVRIADAPPVTHLEWRDDAATRANLLTYSRGAGAFVGAAVRRAPKHAIPIALRRARFQAHLWGFAAEEGRMFGPATSWAFIRGFARGLRIGPRSFLEPEDLAA